MGPRRFERGPRVSNTSDDLAESKPMGSHFGAGAAPNFHFSGDWDVRWGYRILTHGHLAIWFRWCLQDDTSFMWVSALLPFLFLGGGFPY